MEIKMESSLDVKKDTADEHGYDVECAGAACS